MNIIIAEKPDVATAIAAMLGEVKLGNGEILKTEHLTNTKYASQIKNARKDGYFKGTHHLITYAYGHLYTLKEPQEVDPNLKSWKMDTLPFLFDDIPLKSAREAYQRNQIKVVKKLFNDKSTKRIIVATDADREGEHIFRTIYKMVGCKKPFERMWIKDMTEEGLRDAFSNLRPGRDYDGLADAATCRAESDYLVGMNLTRAMTLKFGGFKNVLSIGRVQTPTLAILVNREKEIQNFVPEDYFTLKATFEHPNGVYEGAWFNGNETRFKDKKRASVVLSKVKGKDGVLSEVNVKEEKENTPLLFNLSELARVMGKTRGFSGQKTLDVAQALYDKHKLITYPRSSSRFLAGRKQGAVGGVLKAIASAFPQYADKPKQKGWKMNRKYFNDAKTASHEAIIPTAKSPNLSKLNADERAVYEIIVKRFLAAFYPPCVWVVTKATTTVEGETFASSGKALKQAGWREVEGIPNANVLPLLGDNDPVTQKDAKLEAKKTQPPKRYDDADLRTAMEKAGKFVEDDELQDVLSGMGLGTEATRGAIVEELVKRGYVRRDRKLLVPTEEKGMALFDVLPVEVLKSPDMTAVWEQKLSEVEEGKLSRDQFLTDMHQEIARMVEQVSGATGEKLKATSPARKSSTASRGTKTSASRKSSSKSSASKVIGKCPKCGGDIVENDKAFGCSNWKNGCKVTIWKNSMEKLGKKNITKTEAKQLLSKGKTTKKVKLHSSSKNKDFEAFLTLDTNYRVQMAFS